MAEQYGITAASSASATVGALIVGKSILIADALPLFRLFGQKRLIYNVAWRVLIYAIIVVLLQFLEELIPVITRYGAISTATEHLLGEIQWPRFWATHIILVVFLGIYSLATAITGAIGRKRILEILLGANRGSSTGAD